MLNQGTAAVEEFESQLKRGANWFYWIAALSMVNSISSLTGSNYAFILGLGITQIIDAIAAGLSGQIGNTGKIIAFAFDLIVAGFFVLFGLLANKKYKWAFIVGMIVYVIDALIFILAKDFLGIIFHGYVLFCIYNGLKACSQLKTLLSEQQQQQPTPVQPA